MAATKRNMNWRGVTFTPSGGSATTFTGVTGISISTGGSIQKFSGDGDRYPTTIMNDFQDIGVSVTLADIAAATANPIGTVGTFVGILKDSKQQTASAGAGDMTVTLNNAMIADIPIGGQHRQWAQDTLSIASFSSDGVTSPLTVSFM